MTARLQRRLADQATVFTVSSAGTWGCAGSEMEPFSEAVLRKRGADAEGFVARELTADMVEQAHLVLTATREHRARVVGMVPASVRRSFTLKEFARLAGPVHDFERPFDTGLDATADVVAAALGRVDLAGRVRGLAKRPPPAHDDIEDPMGAPLSIYAARAEEIDQACALALDLLLGPSH